MAAYLDKYHIELNGQGYILSNSQSGTKYYQKKRAPTFVNKFGGGDSSYRDSTYWQYWASVNWRNGAKQLRVDDPGKFWNSSNINVNQLEELTLSRKLTSIGQTAAGTKVNAIESWRSNQSWWDSNYGYRQQLTITAPTASQIPSGYPVKVTIDTAALQTAGKVLANRNDWRVVYFNGSSSVELKRDYVSTTATYFATQAAIAAGASDSNYFVYYGYSGASTNNQPTTEADWNAVYSMYGATPDANTIALYHFREGSGTTVNDDSSHSNNISTTNSPTWSTSGMLGRDLSFTGTAYAEAPSNSDFDLGSLTLEGYFYFNSLSGQQTLIGRKASSGDEGYEISTDGGGTLRMLVKGPGGTLGVASYSTSNMSDSRTYHIAGTYDGTTVKLFVDGTQVASQAFSDGLVTSTGALFLGRNVNATTGNGNFKASHIRVSNTARTSFSYGIGSTNQPIVSSGSETTTQPPSSSFDTYTGNSDGKIYKWDGVSTFSEVFDCRRITWYESGTDTDMKVGDVGGTETAQAQSFQVGATALKVSAVQLNLKKTAGTPGDITVRIETDSTSKPSGTLANANLTTTISAFTTASYDWITVNFPSAVSLSASTTYWIVLKTAAAANDNNYAWSTDGSSPTYANGNMATSTDGGSTWTADSAKDAYFRVLGEATQVNDLLVTQVGGTQKMLIATGDITSQTNGDAKLYSFDGTNFTLEKVFATATESQITKLAEYNSKLYAGVGPQAKVYEGTSPTSWTLSKDINTPQNPGYIYAMKEYNGKFYVGGGSPEFTPDKYYNGFWYGFDGTTWTSQYPFDFTVIQDFEFYDAFLFGATYDGRTYVFDTATLNPLFNFKDDYDFRVSILAQQLYDDKIYFLLYPQSNSNDTNSGVWVFDRHGMSNAYTLAGVTGFRCGAVVNNILLLGTGDDGYVYKVDLDNYVTTGYLQTSYFDANLPSIDKLYNQVTITHDPLVTGQSIKIYYKFKESDDWTLIGTSSTVGSTEATLSFASGTYSKKISLKYELNTDNTSVTPKLKEVVLQYTLLPVRKWLWNLRVKAKKSLTLLDKSVESRTATQIRADIDTANSSNELLHFTDIDGSTYTVLFSEMDTSSWVVNQSDVNEDEILITLLEA